MVKLAVGISYFNSVKELPRLLNQIHGKVDLIIGIDGRYPKFKWKSNISTDGSNELLSKYGVVQINKSPIEQIDKRNQYLEIAEKAGMDFVLVLDSDDFIHKDYQDWDLFYKQLEDLPKDEYLANVWIWMSPLHVANWNMVTDNTWHLYTRLIRPDKIQYDITHWTYSLKYDPSIFQNASKTIEGLRFDSDSILRAQQYIKKGERWAFKQMQEENARFETPRAKRMRLNYWIKDIKKILAMPKVRVIEDNTKDKITKKLK